eukprot:289788-Karenia_brevis.AAC.1
MPSDSARGTMTKSEPWISVNACSNTGNIYTALYSENPDKTVFADRCALLQRCAVSYHDRVDAYFCHTFIFARHTAAPGSHGP